MKKILFVMTFAVTAASAFADTPIQLALTPDIALYPRTDFVRGLTLEIWGENPQAGLAIGFVNGSTGDSAGLSVGLANYADSYTGVQWGLVNLSTENFIGAQLGWVNVAQGTFQGLEWGFVNISEDTTGLQVGGFNYAEKLDGVQVGFVNVARNNALFTEFPQQLSPVFPFVNWSF
jgi:hypothetical protein